MSLPCPSCYGAGRFTCRQCDGTPTRRCWSCNADDIPPAHLNDIGTACWHAAHLAPDCRCCKGGVITCPCGTGTAVCESCAGTGSVASYTAPSGATFPVLTGGCVPSRHPRRFGRDDKRFTPGLGSWIVSGSGAWICLSPSGDCNPADGYATTATHPEPPPLERTPARRGCCGGAHDCGECGAAGTWIEFHGMADGYCSRCHYRG